MSLAAGSKAPDFTMPTDGGGSISLAALKGKTVILYFYPKDDTTGCTAEACGFRDAEADFSGASATVIGVSKDSVASHDKFKKKHELQFPLAADETKSALEAYGVWQEKSMYGRKYMGVERTTFLIGADGRIARIWRKVKVPGHAEAVLEAARSI